LEKLSNPTIDIGTYKSRCLNCNSFADFHEAVHTTIPGDSEAVGCGIVWENMVCLYNSSAMQNIVKSLRPDLKLLTRAIPPDIIEV
jgi:hypothetical protein